MNAARGEEEEGKEKKDEKEEEELDSTVFSLSLSSPLPIGSTDGAWKPSITIVAHEFLHVLWCRNLWDGCHGSELGVIEDILHEEDADGLEVAVDTFRDVVEHKATSENPQDTEDLELQRYSQA